MVHATGPRPPTAIVLASLACDAYSAQALLQGALAAALRRLNRAAGRHHEGVHQALHSLKGVFNSDLMRQLRNLEVAVAFYKHADEFKVDAMLAAIDVAVEMSSRNRGSSSPASSTWSTYGSSTPAAASQRIGAPSATSPAVARPRRRCPEVARAPGEERPRPGATDEDGTSEHTEGAKSREGHNDTYHIVRSSTSEFGDEQISLKGKADHIKDNADNMKERHNDTYRIENDEADQQISPKEKVARLKGAHNDVDYYSEDGSGDQTLSLKVGVCHTKVGHNDTYHNENDKADQQISHKENVDHMMGAHSGICGCDEADFDEPLRAFSRACTRLGRDPVTELAILIGRGRAMPD